MYLLLAAVTVVVEMIEIEGAAVLMHHFQGQVQFDVATAINDHCYHSKAKIVTDSTVDLNQPKN